MGFTKIYQKMKVIKKLTNRLKLNQIFINKKMVVIIY